MIVVGGGFEEGNAVVYGGSYISVSAWASAVGLIRAGGAYTGTYCASVSVAAAGTSQSSGTQAKGWWSYAQTFFTRANGTWWYLFNVSNSDNERCFAQFWDGTDYHIALFKGTAGGTPLAKSTTGLTTPGSTWYKVKWEFNAGTWKCWSDISGSWAEEISYTEPSITSLTEFRMNINGTSNESGKGYTAPFIDDCLAWDDDGDNWNSRITTMSDFPRISAVHVPTSGTDYDKVDEVPPNHTDKPAGDNADMVYGCTDLLVPSEYVQAVMVTRVDGSVTGEQAEFSKFNVKEGSTVYSDSEEDGRRVQFGTNGLGTGTWWTVAGYYPWTPGTNANWPATLFNACEYGCHVLSAYTDQVTAQAIYFGDNYEWTPPPAGPTVVTHVPAIYAYAPARSGPPGCIQR